jgi:hypothetical protein
VIGQTAVIDVVGEIEHDAFGVHAERGGDELGVDRVDQVREGGADAYWATPVCHKEGSRARREQVEQIKSAPLAQMLSLDRGFT